MKILVYFSLNLWNDRYNTMHGVEKEDTKTIFKEKAIKRLGELYEKKEGIKKEYGY